MEKEKSCGAIVINDEKILMIKQTNGDWGFPKGHCENGETEVQTAIRETKEETNIDIKVNENKRYEIEYIVEESGNYKKAVYFVAKMIEGKIKMQESEIQEIEWVPLEEVVEKITHDNLKEMFKKVLKELN